MAHVFREVSVIPFLFLSLSNILWFCCSSFQTERHFSSLGFVRCLLALFILVWQWFSTSTSSPPAPAVASVLVHSESLHTLGMILFTLTAVPTVPMWNVLSVTDSPLQPSPSLSLPCWHLLLGISSSNQTQYNCNGPCELPLLAQTLYPFWTNFHTPCCPGL